MTLSICDSHCSIKSKRSIGDSIRVSAMRSEFIIYVFILASFINKYAEFHQSGNNDLLIYEFVVRLLLVIGDLYRMSVRKFPTLIISRSVNNIKNYGCYSSNVKWKEDQVVHYFETYFIYFVAEIANFVKVPIKRYFENNSGAGQVTFFFNLGQNNPWNFPNFVQNIFKNVKETL